MKQHWLHGAIEKFDAMLDSTPTLLKTLGQLTNRVLLCYCEKDAPCHGDVLVRVWERKFLNTPDPETPLEAAEVGMCNDRGLNQSQTFEIGSVPQNRVPQLVLSVRDHHPNPAQPSEQYFPA